MQYLPKQLISFSTFLCLFLASLCVYAQPCAVSSTNIGGVAFKDFNSNGVKDATDGLLAGIEVKVYDCAGALVGSDISDANGNWFVTVPIAPSASTKYRVEFTIPTTLTGLQPSASGTGNKTDVQFVSAASCTVNFGVNYPSDYCQANPNILTSCYTFGNQITGGNNGVDVLVSFPNNSGNTALNATDAQYSTPTTHSVLLKANQIGTTWGLAYARITNKVYAASFFKKHTGFGKGADGILNNTDDAGAIYVINPSNNTVSSIFTVPNATTNSHNTADYLVDNGNTAWDAVGKTSLGGMDISDDEDSLFVMNLQDRKLYALNPITGAVQNSVAMPTTLPGCGAAGDARPFAVEYYRGRVYVGIICSAESNQLATSINAYIYEVNASTMVVSAAPVFQMDMDYTRGKANNSAGELAAWRPWFATYRTLAADHTVVYPQPIFTSLAFDNDNLILGFRDRIGDQVGQYVPANPSVPASGDYEPRPAGDILRACGSLNSWTLESNGRCGGTGSAPQNSNQGPGKGEFYYGDAYSYSNGTPGVGDTHDELVLGGVLQIPGFSNVAATVFDPIPNGSAIFDGGVRWQSNSTGNFAQAYRLYDDVVAAGDLGKANGLGDLIALCAAPPIEIGNYVWLDTDRNGIQDACETPLAGVQVSLYKTDGTLVATKTTDATGNYYFKDYQQYGAGYDTLAINTQYYIVVGKGGSQFNTGTDQLTISGTPYTLTADNTGKTPNADQNDNDGTLTSGLSGALGTAINGFPSTTVTTGGAGYVNHTLDFGFKPATCEITTITAAQGSCNDNGTPTNTADDYYLATVTVTFSNKPATGTLNLSGAATASVAVASTTSTTTHIFTAVQLPANGTTQSLTAAFSADALCTFTNNAISAVSSCQSDPCVTNATTIGGIAFKDYNENGIKTANEGTQNGILVHVYDCNGAEVAGSPVTTDANGSWYITGLTFSATNKYRVEFTIPAILIGLQPSASGTGNKTDVQFVSAASCTVNFGVNYPSDYCQDNPLLVTPCYVNGEALGGTATGERDAFVGVPFSFAGNGLSSDNNYLADIKDIGSTWGVAIQKSTKMIFTSSVMKRQVSFGPDDNNPATSTHTTGGIYTIDYNNPTTPITSLWLDLNTLAGVNTGTDVHAGLSGDPTVPNRDAAAFAQVGKMSIGDLDISEDGTKLYAVNLNTKTLLIIDIASKTLVNSYPIPNPNCTNSDNMVATTYHFSNTTSSIIGKGATWTDGKSILTGESSESNTNLADFNPTSAPQEIFKTPAFGNALALPLTIGNGTYDVTLYFRDYGVGTGARIFNILMEGNTVKNNFDIEADNLAKWNYLDKTVTGTDNGNFNNFGWVANEQTFRVTVTDGTLNINLNRVSGFAALLSGVKVINTATTPNIASDHRPWGLGVKNGKVYVGTVCSGESSGLRKDVTATVYELSSGTFTSVLSFSFDHKREFSVRGPNNAELPATWEAWSDDNTYATWDNNSGTSFIQPNHHQPILSDIDFDNAGNMILGICDRLGHQVGYNNYTPTLATSILEVAFSAGDILKACKTGAAWSIEGSGGCAQPFSGISSNYINNTGINDGEFFGQDQAITSTTGNGHDETSWGGIVYSKNTNQVILTFLDPKLALNSGGFSWMDNANGSYVKGYEVFGNSLDPAAPPGLFGKANGLGDVEMMCNMAPIEIGNYIWNDTDKDGVQDACETPLAAVKVALYKDVAGTLTKIAETTTNASGEYYFSAKNKLGATWTGTGVDTTLLASQAYKIVFGETQYTAGQLTIGTTTYNLTQKDATTNTGNDQNDSDAAETSIVGTIYPAITLTTGAAGSVNHTLDAGFYSCPTITMPSSNQAICVGSAGTDITVQTNQNTASSIQFVKFTADQMAGASPTATEATTIYAGTAIGSAVTPSGGANPYTATYTWNSADFPNATNASITYYVYGIIAPDGGAACRPTQEIQIIVSPLVSAGIATNPAPICQNGSGLTSVGLFGQLASEMAGGIWSQIAGTSIGTALNTATGILNPNGIANGTYTFRYTVTGIAPCPNDTEDVTVTIQTCCPPKVCLPITITRN